jgi:hypothetical protein
MAKMDEFINPKSMLTPGVAGAVTTAITNTLAIQFALPPNYTGLFISFLFGAIVFASPVAAAIWARFAMYVLNSLLIFSVALGTNQVGTRATTKLAALSVGDHAATPNVISPARASVITIGPHDETFFANWLDNTIPKRKESITAISALSPVEAKGALAELGLPTATTSSAKPLLIKQTAAATDAKEVEQIDSAIAIAKERVKTLPHG